MLLSHPFLHRAAGAGLALALFLAPASSAQDRARPRVGLVLSGGGARGAAHVGVLQVLEELQVPVDYVVGTSIGSIVGGLYAVGYSPSEMAEIFEEANWASILSDDAPRDELWYRRRQDDRRFQVDLEFGWVDGGLTLPPGLIQGLNVEAFLRSLLLSTPTDVDFDSLRIPFRCVATDLADGSAVVADSGDLAGAIRASMSLPGIFAPVERDGRILVDGGVVDNVPIGLVRSLGAEIVIAVDISTPVGDPRSKLSPLGVSDQVISLLMSENRRRSMESLGPGDIGIVPDLGDVTVMAFDRTVEAIGFGRRSADTVRDSLARLSVDDATWRAWMHAQRRPRFEPLSLRRVVIAEGSPISDSILRHATGLRPGDALDGESLARAHRRLTGLDLFEHIELDLVPSSDDTGSADLVVRPEPKPWGPHYVRFRIGAATDLRGSGDFDLGIQHTARPLNALAGEWRNELEVGTRTRLLSEFYQPLDPGLRWFVSPSVSYAQDNLPVIVERESVAEVGIDVFEVGAAVGRNLGTWGEVRTRYGYLSGSARPTISAPGLLRGRTSIDRLQLTTALSADTIDNVQFPRHGYFGNTTWNYSDAALGSDEHKSSLTARAGAPITRGALTLLPALEAGTLLDGEAGVGGEFFLGGIQRLSGLNQRELSGNHYALATALLYYRLSESTTRFGTSTYLGASLELGGIWETRGQASTGDTILAGSIFAGVESLLGPVYVGLGAAEGGEHAVYVLISPGF